MPASAQASSSRPPGAPETPIAPSSEPPASIFSPPPTAATPGPVADAALRAPGLRGVGELGGVGAEARRGIGLGDRHVGRVRPGEAVAQQHLHHAHAVDDRDRRLVAAGAAFRERRLRRLERGFRRQDLDRERRPPRARRHAQHSARTRQRPSLLLHEEGEFLAGFGVRHQLVAGLPRERLEVLHRARDRWRAPSAPAPTACRSAPSWCAGSAAGSSARARRVPCRSS